MNFVIKIAMVSGAVLIGLGARFFFKGKQDNPVEEIAEEIIKEETNLDIDLSPSSPEKGK